MKKSKLVTNLTGFALSAAMLIGSSAPAFASDFTEDSNTTIPIAATVEGSYKITLPAAIDHFETLMDATWGVTENVYIYAPVTVDFTQLSGKGLHITEDEIEVTSGTDTLKKPASGQLIIAPGTEFDTTKVTSIPGSNMATALANRLPSYDKIITDEIYTLSSNGGSFVEGEDITIARLWMQDATTTKVGANLQTEAGVNVAPKDVHVGTYTGSLSVTWELVDINPDLLATP